MKPNITNTMPTKGQFTIIWTYDNKIYSDNCRWEKDQLQVYHYTSDIWQDINHHNAIPTLNTKIYYIQL